MTTPLPTRRPERRKIAFTATFATDDCGDRAEVIGRLKRLLKHLLRAWRFRCTGIEESDTKATTTRPGANKAILEGALSQGSESEK